MLLAFFVSLASVASAQQQVDLDGLVASVGEDPDNVASLVEQAVRTSPAQVHEIVNVLLANYPELAEEVVFGAVAGLPSAEEDIVRRVVNRAILYRPGLASEIALGARRATTGMEPIINAAAVAALRTVATNPRLVGLEPGQTGSSSIPGVFVDGSILSPAR